MICGNCKQEIGDASVCPYCHTEQQNSQPYFLPAGTVIGSKYVIKRVLGEGGFGVTYLGRDTFFERDVAVKEYYPHGFSYRNTASSRSVYVSPASAKDVFEHGKKRFLSEGKTLVRFNGEPGVVSVIDFIEENNTAYLVMEYLEGVTLQQYLKQHGAMSADEAFDLLDPVMKTLEKIHAAGVIHRDISPDNIMRLNNGQLKLMDFGAAKEFLDENRSMSVMLKKGYAPEEQYRRNGRQGPWTDVYALCATIYRCITGTSPEESLDRLVNDTLQKPSQIGAKISPALENVLMYGLAVRAENRCQSMTELLQRIGDARRPVQPPVTAAEKAEPTVPVVATAVKRDPHMTVFADDHDQPRPTVPNTPDTGYAYARKPAVAQPVSSAQPRPVYPQPKPPYDPAAAPSVKPEKKRKKGVILVCSIVGSVILIACILIALLWAVPNMKLKSDCKEWIEDVYSGDYNTTLDACKKSYSGVFGNIDEDKVKEVANDLVDESKEDDLKSIKVIKASSMTNKEIDIQKDKWKEEGFEDTDKISDIKIITFSLEYTYENKDSGTKVEDIKGYGTLCAVKVSGKWYFDIYRLHN